MITLQATISILVIVSFALPSSSAFIRLSKPLTFIESTRNDTEERGHRKINYKDDSRQSGTTSIDPGRNAPLGLLKLKSGSVAGAALLGIAALAALLPSLNGLSSFVNPQPYPIYYRHMLHHLQKRTSYIAGMNLPPFVTENIYKAWKRGKELGFECDLLYNCRKTVPQLMNAIDGSWVPS